MTIKVKSQAQLHAELSKLRRRVAELEGVVATYDQRESVLYESESRLHTVLTHAPIILWSINTERIFTFAAGKGLDMVGSTPNQMIGRPVHAVYQDAPQLELDMGRALGGEIFTSHLNLKGLTFQVRYTPLFDPDAQVIGVTALAVDVTERQLMTELLAQSEERHRAAAELTSDYAYAFRVEAEGTLVNEWVTGSFVYITGFTMGELEAQGGWSRLIHPDDKVIAQQRLEAILKGQARLSEFRIITKDKRVRWIQDHARPVWDEIQGRTVHIYGAALDITEHKQAEQALQKAHADLEKRVASRTAELAMANATLRQEIRERQQLQARLSAIYQLGRELTLMHDETTIVQRVLKTATSLLRFDFATYGLVDWSTQVLEYRYRMAEESMQEVDLCLPLNQGQVIGGIGVSVVHSGQALIVVDTEKESCYTLPHPERMTRSALCVPLRIGQQITGVLIAESRRSDNFTADDQQLLQTLADQTAIAIENARLYQHLQNQMQVLQEAQAQLVRSEKMAALGRLSAAIAHEINNPLQAINNVLLLFREELERYQLTGDLEDYLNITGQEIERISTITNRMRNFYQPLGRELPTMSALSLATIDEFYRPTPQEWQWIDLPEALAAVLHLVDSQLRQRQVAVKRQWVKNLPPIEGNSNHLKQVFLNLVLNAIEGMEGQGGTLYLSLMLDQAPLLEGRLLSVMRIEFSDTGSGIALDALPHLFEPFFSTKKQGSGLGLFISHKIIEAHHGQINVESQIGLGTTFCVLLPLEQPGKVVRNDQQFRS